MDNGHDRNRKRCRETLIKLFCFVINDSEQVLPPLGITRINHLFFFASYLEQGRKNEKKELEKSYSVIRHSKAHTCAQYEIIPANSAMV
jgi:hypothetical protein